MKLTFVLRMLGHVLASQLLLSACAHQGEPAQRNIVLPAQWSGFHAAGAPFRLTVPDWWKRFGDPVLDQLIDDALRTNNTLAAASARVRRAQAQVRLIGASRHPSIAVEASAGLIDALNTSDTMLSNSVVASLTYQLDLWGTLAAQRDEAALEWRATMADWHAARLALIGTTAALYWNVAYLNEQIDLCEANIVDAQRSLTIAVTRHRAGAVSAADVAQAETALALLQAQRTQLLQERTEGRNALAIVFDRPPQYRPAERDRLPDLVPLQIPAGLPADLLQYRPDLRMRLTSAVLRAAVNGGNLVPTKCFDGNQSGRDCG